MNFFRNVVWMQASTLMLLPALSMGDVLISRPYAHPLIAPITVGQRVEKPRILDPINAIVAYCQERHGLTIGREEAIKTADDIRLAFRLLEDEARRVDALPSQREVGEA